jgi:hypothetical protein
MIVRINHFADERRGRVMFRERSVRQCIVRPGSGKEDAQMD